MPPLPKKKHSHGRQGGRSAHFGMKAKTRAICPECRSTRLPHRACTNCGYYNGREVVAVDNAE